MIHADAVIRKGHMRNVRRGSGHVARNAIVLRAFPLAALAVHFTAVGRMALDAGGAVVGDAFLALRFAMRAVAGDARERFRALVATTLVQLLDLSDHGEQGALCLQGVIVAELLKR